MRTLVLLLAALTLAGCQSTTGPDVVTVAAADPCLDMPCIEAVLDREGATLDVELRLPAGLGTVHLPLYKEPLGAAPDGLAHFITLDGGGPLPETVEVGEGGLTLRYRVALEHHLAQPVHGVDEVPHPTSGGYTLVGRAFIPVLKTDAGRIARGQLTLRQRSPRPDDALISSVGEGETLTAGLDDLRDGVYVLGRFHHRQTRLGDLVVDVVSADYGPEDVEALSGRFVVLHEVATRAFGPLASNRRLIVFNRTAQGFMGGMIRNAISVLSSTAPEAKAMTPLGSLLVHEFMHLWFKGEERWIGEGFDVYAQLLMQQALDGASEAEGLDYFLDTAHEYLTSIGARRIADLDDDAGYPAGATLAFCLDVELRHRDSSFAVVWRGYRAGAGDARGRGADFLDHLERVAPPVRAQAEAWLSTSGAIDVGACLERAGYAVERRTYRGYSLRSIALEVVRSPSFSMQRAELFKVLEGSPFAVGDVITAVDGASIGRLPELSYALSDKAPGALVSFEVMRGGERVGLKVALPEVDESGRPEELRLVATGTGARSPFAAGSLTSP